MKKKIKNSIATLICLGLAAFVLCSTASALSPILAKEIGNPDSYIYTSVSDPGTGKTYSSLNTTERGTWDHSLVITDKDGNILKSVIREYEGTQFIFSMDINIYTQRIVAVGYTNGAVTGPLPEGVSFAAVVFVYDLEGNEILTKQFVTEDSTYTGAFAVASDGQSSNFWIGGDTYVFSAYGGLDRVAFAMLMDINTGAKIRYFTINPGPEKDELLYGIDTQDSQIPYADVFLCGANTNLDQNVPYKGWVIGCSYAGNILMTYRNNNPLANYDTIFSYYLDAMDDAIILIESSFDSDWRSCEGYITKITLSGQPMWFRQMEENSSGRWNGFCQFHIKGNVIYVSGYYDKDNTENNFYVPLIYKWNYETGNKIDKWVNEEPKYQEYFMDIFWFSPLRVDVTGERASGGDRRGILYIFEDKYMEVDVSASTTSQTINFYNLDVSITLPGGSGDGSISCEIISPVTDVDPPPGYILLEMGGGESYAYVINSTVTVPDGTRTTIEFKYPTLPPGIEDPYVTVKQWDGTKWISLHSTVNTANKTVTVTIPQFSLFALMVVTDPVAAIEGLIANVHDINLRQGLDESFCKKLENAIKALEKAKAGDSDVIGMLQAFVNECEAQRGKGITDAQADQLINEANAIIAVMQ